MSSTDQRGATTGPRTAEAGKSLAAPATSTLSRKPLKSVTTLADLENNFEFRKRIQESIPRHMTPERMLRTFTSAVRKAPLLRHADIRDLIGCFLTAAQCGLEPNTPLQHLHLIPFKRSKYNPATRQREDAGVEVQVIFGYPGLLELSYRSPLVKSISAAVVYEHDEFDFSMGTESFLQHRPLGRSEKILFAYSVAQLADGHAFRVMPWPEIEAIRNRSQAYRMALSHRDDARSKGRADPLSWTEAPWNRFEAAMAAKTPFRALSKWLPRSVELASVVSIDEAQERRRNIDWGSVIDASDGDYVAEAALQSDMAEEGDDSGAMDDAQKRALEQKQEEERRQEDDRRRGDGPAPGSVFGEAEGTGGGDPGPQPREEPTKADPKPTPKPRATKPKPADLAPLDAVVLDAFGEPVDNVVHASRLDWAHAYATAWEGCDSEARTEALAEHNADALIEVSLHPKAKEVIAGLTLPTARMKRVVAEVVAAEAKAAAEAKEKAEAAERAEAVASDDNPTKDADRDWAVALCADAEKASLDDVKAMVAHNGIRARMKDLGARRPELYEMVEKAFGARLQRKG